MRKINRSSEPESVGSILRRMDLPVQLAPQCCEAGREYTVLSKRGFQKGNILVKSIERLERHTDDE